MQFPFQLTGNSMKGQKMIEFKTVLNEHMLFGGGIANNLRNEIPRLEKTLMSFLQSQSHHDKFKYALSIISRILTAYNRHGLSHLRSVVAKTEYCQFVSNDYSKFHPIKSIYLFFLGVWFYDNNSLIQSSIQNTYEDKYRGEEDKKFLYQWMLSTLLQDIGFIYSHLENDTKSDRKLIDSLISWEHLKTITLGINTRTESHLKEIFNSFKAKYLSNMPPPTNCYEINNGVKILERLSCVPWAVDLYGNWNGFNLFQILQPELDHNGLPILQNYAYTTEKMMLSNQMRINHGIIGSLIITQYSLFWQWIYMKIKDIDIESYNDLSNGEDINIMKFIRFDLPAYRSIAYHNIHPKSDTNLSGIIDISLNNDPISFLSMLCNDLQVYINCNESRNHNDKLLYLSYRAHRTSEGVILLDGMKSNIHRTELCINNNDADELLIKLEQRLNDINSVISIRGLNYSLEETDV